MIPEAEAQKLIDRLERHARRSRPFLIYGLLAILAGFLLLTFYINGLRNAAEARARDLEVRKLELRKRLDQAGRLAAGEYSAAEAPQVLMRIRHILGEASETTRELNRDSKAAAPAVAAAAHQPHEHAPDPEPAAPTKAVPSPKAETVAAPTPRPPVIRIFLHIGDKGQFGGAKELEWSLGGRSLGGTRIVVPGIEMVDGGDDTLRCLKRVDCARAREVAAFVNARLRGRSLAVRDLSGRYEQARNVRPGTYEVWLGPGPVLVAAE